MPNLIKNYDNILNNKINEQNMSIETINRITKDDISNCDNLVKLLQRMSPNFLEKFEIKELIGSGSESVVFKVLNKINKEVY